MHEMGIAMEIADIITTSIPKDMKNAKVKAVNLTIGKLTAIVPESLKFCFEAISSNTTLSETKINIIEIPVVAKCNKCSNQWAVSEPIFFCPSCQSSSVEILSGREFEITSIEVECEDNNSE